MSLNSWGNFPQITSKVIQIKSLINVGDALKSNNTLIPYGNGRSYGDSALADIQLDMRAANFFLDFNEDNGVLEVQAGVLLADILKHFVPRGWFLTVSPGTKLITIGGAIASDIHGKNHHHDGCFSETLVSIKIQLPNSEIIECSKVKNPEIFRATCAGQGLTGVILSAKLILKKISSSRLATTTYKCSNLKETFSAFETSKDSSYSVSWIDCMASGSKLGRSLVTTGEFLDDKKMDYLNSKKITIPFPFPSFVLNKWFVRLFNILYFNKVFNNVSHSEAGIDSFFYPLDSIGKWNNIYGKKGFVQYQFILPFSNSYDGIEEALELISKSGRGSFLAVLKLYGKENENYLSFPMEGYSLALDFKIDDSLFDFLKQLDDLVLRYKGRIYLAKDSRVSEQIFAAGYPQLNKFKEVRTQLDPDKKMSSHQSARIGL